MKFTVAKKAIALTGAVAMLGSVAACGSDTASGKPAQDKDVTEITVWAWEPTLTQVAKDFTKKTGIKVEMEILGNDDYANKAAIELAGKSDNLDVIFLRPLTDLKQYCQNGWLTDISRIGDDADFDLSDYFEASLDSCTYDGVLYGVPIVAES